MKTMLLGICVAGLVVGSTGCATNKIWADGATVSERYFGDVGIAGDACNVTIQNGSRVDKLSILGDRNIVTVEDGATVYKVEFVGNGNRVILPELMRLLRTSTWGTNQIIRRPSAEEAYEPSVDIGATAPPAPAYTAPPLRETPSDGTRRGTLPPAEIKPEEPRIVEPEDI